MSGAVATRTGTAPAPGGGTGTVAEVRPGSGVGRTVPVPPELSGTLVYSRAGGLWLLELPSGRLSPLTATPPNVESKEPAWSPDGRQIAYAYLPSPGKEPPFGDLHLVRPGEAPTVIVAHERPGDLFLAPTWLPGGKELLYTRVTLVTRNGEIVDSTAAIERFDLVTKRRSTFVPNASMSAASPDGKRLAYVQVAPQTYEESLWVANLDGSEAKQLFGIDDFASFNAPRFAPDGRRLVFAATGGGRNALPRRGSANGWDTWLGLLQPRTAYAHGVPWDLWLVGTDGGTPEKITNVAEDSPTPAWSPDGKRIIMLGEYALYLVDVEQRSVAQLVEGGGFGGISWAAP